MHISSATAESNPIRVIYHQSDGGSRESQALARYALETGRRLLLFNNAEKIPEEHIRTGQLISGSVEILESFIGPQKPEYFPPWAIIAAGREIHYGESLDLKRYKTPRFIKPTDRLKRFDGMLWQPNEPVPEGTLEIQEPVTILREGRHYIHEGEILTSAWYSQEADPSDHQMTCPEIPPSVEIPRTWSGTIDTAETQEYGNIILECHAPFACGWYGESKDFMIYGTWLEAGWKKLCETRFKDQQQ
jgi:ATP-grasp domain, R2K clade family 2